MVQILKIMCDFHNKYHTLFFENQNKMLLSMKEFVSELISSIHSFLNFSAPSANL